MNLKAIPWLLYSENMKIYNVAVIGAGPAGIFAAITASQVTDNVVLIERNDSIGKKLLITGKGRCNLTNDSDIDTFIEKFGKSGLFLRNVFQRFFNKDLIDFFEKQGLKLKRERQGRIFPQTDKSLSVVNTLKQCLLNNNVQIIYNKKIVKINKENDIFTLMYDDRRVIETKNVILATGGISFKSTGSSGDGHKIASVFGHKIEPLIPGLVPLKTKESWIKELQGLALKNVALTFKYGSKKIKTEIGECIFTHFGISGPLVLDISGKITPLLKSHKEISLLIDMKPGLTNEKLGQRLLRDIQSNGNMSLKNMLKGLLPNTLIPVLLNLCNLDHHKKCNQIAKDERQSIVDLIKALPVTIIGSLNIEDAMVTLGGINNKEINPKTMESRIVKNLYFAGEIINGGAQSGGYNLQQAFSTGYLAGYSAVHE